MYIWVGVNPTSTLHNTTVPVLPVRYSLEMSTVVGSVYVSTRLVVGTYTYLRRVIDCMRIYVSYIWAYRIGHVCMCLHIYGTCEVIWKCSHENFRNGRSICRKNPQQQGLLTNYFELVSNIHTRSDC
jgi:hypothetical protein